MQPCVSLPFCLYSARANGKMWAKGDEEMKISFFHSLIANQLNITTVISVVGLAISLFTVIQNLISRRKKLKAQVFSFDAYRDMMFITLSIENCSQLPIAITDIRYVTQQGQFSCTPVPTLVHENTRKSGNTVLEHKTTYSTRIPIEISALGAFSGVILFEHLKEMSETPPKTLTFEFRTNRGKAVRKTIELPADILSRRRSY